MRPAISGVRLRMGRHPLLYRTLLVVAGLLAALPLPARSQTLLTIFGGLGQNSAVRRMFTGTAGARISVGWPDTGRRAVFVLDALAVNYERVQGRNGMALESALGRWWQLSNRSGSPAPLAFAEAGMGKRWGGGGLSWYPLAEGGLGFAFRGSSTGGREIPFIGYRKRWALHSTLRNDNQVVFGVRFELVK